MVRDSTHNPGLAELVSVEVFPEHDSTGIGQLTVSERHLNPNWVVHAGTLFTLVDTTMGASLMRKLDESEICTTLQISMNFLRPVVDGLVERDARVINKGRRFANAHGELYT